MIDHLYFGDHRDVPPYVREPWHENLAASARLAAWMGEVMAAEDLPHLRVDCDAPWSRWSRRSHSAAAVAVRGDELTRIPGCPGVAEGSARVILDPADPFALEPGEVLIAPMTDPTWTPLFVTAAAGS